MLKLMLTSAVIAALLSDHASANCDYCTNKVVLTRDLADCLAEKIDGEISNLERTKASAVLVSLLDCSGASVATMRGGQSIPDGAVKPAEPTLSLLLDQPRLVCLRSLVNAQDVNWTPVAIFVLRDQCR
ncbi:hypothetical protein ACVNHC_05475 [Pannonibacter sp. Q-1]